MDGSTLPAHVSSPGLSIVTAPRLEPLFERLAEAVGGDPLPPLERETILVAQNKGLRAWLTHELARAHGCAAGLDLRAPLTFVTDLARELVPGARPPGGERHPYDAGPLAWRLAPMLEALDDDPAYAPLRSYLDRTGGRAMPLAARLAALFDDYQVYRPDVLAAWAAGADPDPAFAHGAWQAALWRRLADDPTLDRAAGLVALAETLRQSETVEHLPRRVSVFGALLFPPLYWRVLAEVARHRPVTVYAVTAGPRPTTEPQAHPLLRALAGRTRDYWTVLADLGAPPPVRLAEPVGEPPRSPVPGPQSLPDALRQLQDALAHDVVPDPVPLRPGDRSVRIHDCHSATRELEALRDSLLDAFAEIDGLRPSDVLVLVPDLATYAPLVDAVFGAEDAAPGLPGQAGVRLPYHVVGHPHAPALRVVEAFGRALRLHDGRVTASELLDLLGTPVVRRAAGIDEAELPQLRAWVREAGVCWGLDAERRGRFDVPADDLHTWRFGLDRLLLGVMAGDDRLVLGHLPCDAAGLGGADLLGRFCEWAEALFASLDAIDRPAPLDAWPARLVQFLDGVFLAQDAEELEAVVFLREQAQELAHLHALAGSPDAAVGFRTVRQHLDGAAGRFEQREPTLTGGVTVAHPLALRHAPHRVVAFLGLGDGVWPRPETSPGFDLLAFAPRPGDASPRALDKQLFVDAVLSARDRLILSRVGRSQKDNAERAASVCLDAFLDAARRHWGADAETLVVEHRLQPFAADYFTPGGPLASYAGQHRVAGAAAPPAAFLDPADHLPTPDDLATVSLGDLADAWVNPSQHVVRRRLRVSLDLGGDALTDDEPTALDALQSYHVRAAVLQGVLDGLSDDELAQRIGRSGMLPGGAPGASWLRRARDQAEPVAAAVRQWGATAPLAVDLDLGGVRVVGTLDHVGARGGLRYRPGKMRDAHVVRAWVDHLALCAERPAETCAVGTDGTTLHFERLSAERARAYLGGLVHGYRQAQRGLLPTFRKASKAYVEKVSPKDREAFALRIGDRDGPRQDFAPSEVAMRAARRGFSDAWSDVTDDQDVHVALATRGRDDPFAPEHYFARWSLCLWAPILTHRRDGVPA